MQELWTEVNAERRRGAETIVADVKSRSRLRAGLDETAAADVVWVLDDLGPTTTCWSVAAAGATSNSRSGLPERSKRSWSALKRALVADDRRTSWLSSVAVLTFGRSLLTSLLTTVFDFGTLLGLTELAGLNYVLSTWIGTVVGSLSNFTINKRLGLLGPGRSRAAGVRPLRRRSGGASALHTLGVWLLTRFGRLPYPGSKLMVAAAVYLVWNYPLNRWFVFNPRHRAGAAESARSP